MTAGLPEDLVRSLRDRARSEQPRDEVHGKRPARPLSSRSLVKAEKTLGFALPASLRDVYNRVANGGFGPGYGLIGLVGGFKSDLNTDVIEDYRLRLLHDEKDPGYFWPAGVLAICHWGCGIYSCIDCRLPEARVVRFDPNPVDEDWSVAWGSESPSLEGWLRRWLAGEELFESGTPDGTFSIER